MSIAAADVTTAQFAVLMVIDQAPGCTQRHVASILEQGEPTVAAMVTRLQTSGLVNKEPHPTEHRAASLTVTDAGRTALRVAGDELKAFNNQIREALGPDMETVAGALGRLMSIDFR
ncbi:putative MarR family transcriptional regulator [Gordonia effusa NBRC 100432]|uniref:Putative MarR family transcriptional regulator n=1 Tax=Gordonia effusa NBRC 100432 TaxID=1077974 RepID=H0QZZ9_9ACTN|nr:putative MarR family transcriptional regulator [Gordonia effusa NBRC 100432]